MNFPRQLSHALIAVLILVSPLSFTTEAVPDYKPACDVYSAQGKRAGITVVAIRTVAESTVRRSCSFVAWSIIPIPVPVNARPWLHYSGRAPPLPFLRIMYS